MDTKDIKKEYIVFIVFTVMFSSLFYGYTGTKSLIYYENFEVLESVDDSYITDEFEVVSLISHSAIKTFQMRMTGDGRKLFGNGVFLCETGESSDEMKILSHEKRINIQKTSTYTHETLIEYMHRRDGEYRIL